MNNTMETEMSKTKRFYCCFKNSDITSSIREDYIYYAYLLSLPKAINFEPLTLNIRLTGCTSEQFHCHHKNGYTAIYPFFPYDGGYDIKVLKVTILLIT